MSENIRFFCEGLQHQIKHKQILRKWISDTAFKEGVYQGDINIILCTDSYLLKLNKKYLGKDELTDVIAFPMIEEKGIIGGDIFISLDRIRNNAKEYKINLFDEFSRVIIHGVLHFCGWKDQNSVLKQEMRQREDFYLENLRKLKGT